MESYLPLFDDFPGHQDHEGFITNLAVPGIRQVVKGREKKKQA
jgi:hypothetical protein